jgi:ATP-dependent protease HslVU (ClpYQ) peptidase subunit
MTLQVVLRGSDGVVIASDTLVSSQPKEMIVTDSNSKMMVKSRFVCTFAGDDCAKYIAMTMVAKAGDSGLENPIQFITNVNEALKDYKTKSGCFPKTQYRKILWVQALDCSEIAIWAASYWALNENFELIAPGHKLGSIFAGDEGNPARYFVEHYFKKNPVKPVSGLKKMAAHVIRTGHLFNPAGVHELEMVVGENGGFIKLRPDDLQPIDNAISGIHAAIDAYFVV